MLQTWACNFTKQGISLQVKYFEFQNIFQNSFFIKLSEYTNLTIGMFTHLLIFLVPIFTFILRHCVYT